MNNKNVFPTVLESGSPRLRSRPFRGPSHLIIPLGKEKGSSFRMQPNSVIMWIKFSPFSRNKLPEALIINTIAWRIEFPKLRHHSSSLIKIKAQFHIQGSLKSLLGIFKKRQDETLVVVVDIRT